MRQSLGSLSELFESRQHVSVQDILETMDGKLSLSCAVLHASLDLGETLLLENAFDEPNDDGVVLGRGQVADGLGDLVLVIAQPLLQCLLNECRVHFLLI